MILLVMVLPGQSGPENLKKSRQKNSCSQINLNIFREIAKKWNLAKNKFHEINLFDLTSFVAWIFL